MRWRSVCVGFKSIISRWSCRVSRTVCRDTPAGRGVMVVNIVLGIVLLRGDVVRWMCDGEGGGAKGVLLKIRFVI